MADLSEREKGSHDVKNARNLTSLGIGERGKLEFEHGINALIEWNEVGGRIVLVQVRTHLRAESRKGGNLILNEAAGLVSNLSSKG